jgi:hypothetical protein
MPSVRDGSDKWKRNAQNATGDYQQGVIAPRVRWDDATAAAANNWTQGVQQAITNGTFQKGVKQTGHDGWQQATLQKGPQRFAEGVRGSGDAYQSGFAPYAKVIQQTNLPARGPKGSQANIDRSTQMSQALYKAKQALKGNKVS